VHPTAADRPPSDRRGGADVLTDIQFTGASTGFGAGTAALLSAALSTPVQLPGTGAPCAPQLAGARAAVPGGAMPAVPAASFAGARPVNPVADRDAGADLGVVRFRTAPSTSIPAPVPTTPTHSTLGYHSPGRPQS
jgi:hypothetical protein